MSKIRISLEVDVAYPEFLNLFGYVDHSNYEDILKEWVEHSFTEYDGYDGWPYPPIEHKVLKAEAVKIEDIQLE